MAFRLVVLTIAFNVHCSVGCSDTALEILSNEQARLEHGAIDGSGTPKSVSEPISFIPLWPYEYEPPEND